MVKQNSLLDSVFHSLADPTRRDILSRVSVHECSVGELAQSYQISFAAVAKHIAVMETAQLVSKHRQGKLQVVRVVPETVKKAKKYIDAYERLWHDRFTALDALLSSKKV